jgi:hypothetical protein
MSTHSWLSSDFGRVVGSDRFMPPLLTLVRIKVVHYIFYWLPSLERGGCECALEFAGLAHEYVLVC